MASKKQKLLGGFALTLVLATSVQSCRPRLQSNLQGEEAASSPMTFYAEVTKEALLTQRPVPVAFLNPVYRSVGRAYVHGSAQTSGKFNIELFPSEEFAVADLVLDINTTANYTVTGNRGRDFLSAQTRTQGKGIKRIYMSEHGIGSHKGVFKGNSTTYLVNTYRGLGSGIALNQFNAQKTSRENETTREVGGKVSANLDSSIDAHLREANEKYLKDVKKPYLDGQRFPGKLNFRTTTNELSVRVLDTKKSADYTAMPPIEKGNAVNVRMHQSLVNEFLDLNRDKLEGEMDPEKIRLIFSKLPVDMAEDDQTQIAAAPNAEATTPVSTATPTPAPEDGQIDLTKMKAKVKFTEQEPVRVSFQDHKIMIVTNAHYLTGDSQDVQNVKAINVLMEYVISKNEKGEFYAKRAPIQARYLESEDQLISKQDDTISQGGYMPSMLYQFFNSASDIANKTVDEGFQYAVKYVYGKNFPTGFTFKPVPMLVRGDLAVNQFDALNGWLSLDYAIDNADRSNRPVGGAASVANNPKCYYGWAPIDLTKFRSVGGSGKVCAFWRTTDTTLDYRHWFTDAQLAKGMCTKDTLLRSFQGTVNAYCPGGLLPNGADDKY